MRLQSGAPCEEDVVNEFLSDVETLRRNARTHIDDGAITDTYGADRSRC